MNMANTLKNDWHDDPSLDISYTYRNITRCFSVIAPKNGVHNTFPSLFTQDSRSLDYFAIYKDNTPIIYTAICKVFSILMSQNLTDDKNWP